MTVLRSKRLEGGEERAGGGLEGDDDGGVYSDLRRFPLPPSLRDIRGAANYANGTA